MGIANLVNMLNPDVVVIGGGVIGAGELLLEPARAVVAERALSPSQGARADRRRPLRRGVGNARRRRARARRDRHAGMTGRLVVCPTPIGNLEDVTLRVLGALRDATVIACEDTRRTRVLLERYGVSATLVSYHEHNERARATQLVERMLAGDVVALVSDAGTPLVSDPGFVLVRACVAAGLAIEVLPGPSAVMSALVASALPSDTWRFVGYLPRKRGAFDDAVLGAGDDRRVRVAQPRRAIAGGARVVGRRAAGRRLPRADEAPRGDRARQRRRARGAICAGAAAWRGRARRRRRAAVRTRAGAGVDALRRLVEAGAKPRPASTVVASLTGVKANALYRALMAAGPVVEPARYLPEPVILYRANFSTNVERVTLALAHKGIEVESRWISYDDRSEVEKVSGQPLVPVVVDHREHIDNVVADSMQIIAYVEGHVPSPPLYPSDEARFAEMMVFIDWFNRVWKVPPNRIEAELASEQPDHMLVTKLAREMATYLDGFDSLLSGASSSSATSSPPPTAVRFRS